MRILIYIVIVFAGALLGAGGKLPEGLTGRLSKLQFVSLLLLLFAMGVNLGADDDVISGFFKLGWQSFILAAFSVGFSILFVRLISGFLAKDEFDDEEGSE